MSAYEQYQKRRGIQVPPKVSGAASRVEAQGYEQAGNLFNELQSEMLQSISKERKGEGKKEGSIIGFGPPDKFGRPTYKRVTLPEGRGTIFNSSFLEAQDKTINLSVSKLFEVEASRLVNLHKNSKTGIEDFTRDYSTYSTSVIETLDDTRTENALALSAGYIGQVGLADITNLRDTAVLKKNIDRNTLIANESVIRMLDLAQQGILYNDDGSLTTIGLTALNEHTLTMANLKAFGVLEGALKVFEEKFMAAQDYGTIIHELRDQPNSVLYKAGLDYMNNTSKVLIQGKPSQHLLASKMSKETRISVGSSIMQLANSRARADDIKRSEEFLTANNGIRAFLETEAQFMKENGRAMDVTELRTSLNAFKISPENHWRHAEFIIQRMTSTLKGDEVAQNQAVQLFKDSQKEQRLILSTAMVEGKKDAYKNILEYAQFNRYIIQPDGTSIPDNETAAWALKEIGKYEKSVSDQMDKDAERGMDIFIETTENKIRLGELTVADVQRKIFKDEFKGTTKELKSTTALRKNLPSFIGAEKSRAPSETLKLARRNEALGFILSKPQADALLREKFSLGIKPNLQELARQWKVMPTVLAQTFEGGYRTNDSKKAFGLMNEFKKFSKAIRKRSVSSDTLDFYNDVETFEATIGTDPEKYAEWIKKQKDESIAAEALREITNASWKGYEDLDDEVKDEMRQEAYQLLDYNQATSLFSARGMDLTAHPDQLEIWASIGDVKIFDDENIAYENSGAFKAEFRFLMKRNLAKHAKIVNRDPSNPDSQRAHMLKAVTSTIEMLAQGPGHYFNTFYSPSGKAGPAISETNWLGPINELIDLGPSWLGLGPEGAMTARERSRTLVFGKNPIEGWVNKAYRRNGFTSITTRRAIIEAFKRGIFTMPRSLNFSQRLNRFFTPHESISFSPNPEDLHDSGNIKIEMVEGTWNDEQGPTFNVWLEHLNMGGGDNPVLVIERSLLNPEGAWRPKALMDILVAEDESGLRAGIDKFLVDRLGPAPTWHLRLLGDGP